MMKRILERKRLERCKKIEKKVQFNQNKFSNEVWLLASFSTDELKKREKVKWIRLKNSNKQNQKKEFIWNSLKKFYHF